MATRSSAAQMLRVVHEVQSAASSTHQNDNSLPARLDLELLALLADEPFDQSEALIRLIAHVYRD